MKKSTEKQLDAEYEKQVTDLYAKLSIDSSKSMSVEQISQEYKRSINNLTAETISFASYYLTR